MEFINHITKESYTGKNLELLSKTGFSGEFLTFNQAFQVGGVVPKGTKSVASLVRFLNNDNPKKAQFKRFAVFHISQIEFNKED
jgi:antirestriction protein ArdC